jgi:hypothetical protein
MSVKKTGGNLGRILCEESQTYRQKDMLPSFSDHDNTGQVRLEIISVGAAKKPIFKAKTSGLADTCETLIFEAGRSPSEEIMMLPNVFCVCQQCPISAVI